MQFLPAHNVFENASGPMDAIAFLRSHSAAVLLIDGEARARKYICDSQTSAPVTAADPWMLEGEAFTFCIPDDTEGSLQLMVQPRMLDAKTHLAADRHLAYHGEISAARLVLWEIEAAKGGGLVFEGGDLQFSNPLTAVESKLLKVLNSNPAALGAATQRVLRKVWADPRAVGIDPWGVDIHSRFGMTRICFSERISEGTAFAVMQELLGKAE